MQACVLQSDVLLRELSAEQTSAMAGRSGLYAVRLRELTKRPLPQVAEQTPLTQSEYTHSGGAVSEGRGVLVNETEPEPLGVTDLEPEDDTEGVPLRERDALLV